MTSLITAISIPIGRREIHLTQVIGIPIEFRLVNPTDLATKFVMIGATVWDDRRVK